MKTFTKTVITFILVTFCTGARLCVSPCFAQSGQTCNTAIQNYAKDSCAYQSWVISGTEMWFKFKANTPYVYISVITTKFGINAPHVHRAELIDGTCSNPIAIADDELPFVDYWDELRIDLDASGLIPGNSYYIKLSRLPSGGKLCDKSTCRAMIQPAGFDICIQDVEVFIPLDFGIEPPSQSHSYVQNKGQIIDTDGNPRSDIVMVAPNSFPSVFVANTAIHYVFSKIDTSISTLDTLHRIDMTLENANPNMRAFKTEQAQGHFNYFLPQTPTGVSSKAFSRLVWNNVYPEIDMQFYSNYNGLKLYFIVRQGGDAEDIEMKIDGASQLIVTPDSGLEIVSSLGKLQFEPGHAYQINPAGNIVPMPWQAKFIKTANNKVKFDIRHYPKNMPLIIQVDRGHTNPILVTATQPQYSMYFGGNADDEIREIVVDNDGNAYFGGTTYSTANLLTPGGLFTSVTGGNANIFIAKFGSASGSLQGIVPDGDRQLWTTYYGGTGDDIFYAIADEGNGVSGKCYITGRTNSPDFPVASTGPAYFQDVLMGNHDAFIIAMDNNTGGHQYWWATYFGGGGYEEGFDVFAKAGITITGITSTNFYSATTCVVPADGGFPKCNILSTYDNSGFGGGYLDGYIAEFRSDGTLLWSTFYGGSDIDIAYAITRDLYGNLFLTGYTFSDSAFPHINQLSAGAYYQNTFGGGDADAFITKFKYTGIHEWCSYFGGNASDVGVDIVTDNIGDIYIAGRTNSPPACNTCICTVPPAGQFPLCPKAGAYFQGSGNTGVYGGDIADGFIARFSSIGEFMWGTYYGGSGDDRISGIDIDYANRLFFVGTTSSSTPATNIVHQGNSWYYNQPNLTGSEDAFVGCFDGANARIWATYYSHPFLTTNGEFGQSIAIYDPTPDNSFFYITGTTNTPLNFHKVSSQPTCCPDAYEQISSNGPAGTSDGFIVRFSFDSVWTNVQEIIKSDDINVTVFPNPATYNINIQLKLLNRKNVTFKVYDIYGKLLKQEAYNDQVGILQYAIDFSLYPDNIYLLQINIANGSAVYKIIKKR